MAKRFFSSIEELGIIKEETLQARLMPPFFAKANAEYFIATSLKKNPDSFWATGIYHISRKAPNPTNFEASESVCRYNIKFADFQFSRL